MKRKISLGPRLRPAPRALHALRRARGTRLDVFGRADVRRTELALIEEYKDAVLRALEAGPPADRETVAELASLPDMVRGYEHMKGANVEAYRVRQAELLTRLEVRGPGRTAGS